VGENASSIFSNFIKSSSKETLELKKKRKLCMYFARTTKYIIVSVYYTGLDLNIYSSLTIEELLFTAKTAVPLGGMASYRLFSTTTVALSVILDLHGTVSELIFLRNRKNTALLDNIENRNYIIQYIDTNKFKIIL